MTAGTPNVKAEFIQQLTARMQAQGVTRAQLAKRIGCSRARVSQVLRPNSNITTKMMVRLADALGLEVHFELRPAP